MNYELMAHGGITEQAMFVLMFLFQIPNNIWKSGLGSVGIALTYLGSVVICVNFAFFNSKVLNVSCVKLFRVQFFPMLFCSFVILGIRMVVDFFINEKTFFYYYLELL
jgi:hypothetical protein